MLITICDVKSPGPGVFSFQMKSFDFASRMSRSEFNAFMIGPSTAKFMSYAETMVIFVGWSSPHLQAKSTQLMIVPQRTYVAGIYPIWHALAFFTFTSTGVMVLPLCIVHDGISECDP
jgi:hypothetical protein